MNSNSDSSEMQSSSLMNGTVFRGEGKVAANTIGQQLTLWNGRKAPPNVDDFA
jgi:hypothetical protein